MARDDYYVLVGRILVYLYARLKGKTKKKPEEYLCPMSKDFPVTREYMDFVLGEMEKHEYISLNVVRAWGGDIVYIDISNIQITQEGIDFLSENSKIRKIVDTIPMAASIFELFQ